MSSGTALGKTLHLLSADSEAAHGFSQVFRRLYPEVATETPAWLLNEDVPPDIIAEIRGAPVLDVFNVGPSEVYGSRILKCRTLVFQPNARLTLTALSSSVGDHALTWCAVVAREIKFLAPDTFAVVQRDPALLGPAGANGANGSNGRGTGGHGQPGTPGEPGQTIELRTLYFLGERLLNEPGNPMPYLRFRIDVPGVRGGDGGKGGDGGAGERGKRGRDGAAKHGRCKHDCGNGGRGGNGAPGMDGGSAGNGSDGGDIVFGGPQPFLDLITFSEINNAGGQPGDSGERGIGGKRGSGGDRGSHHRFCRDTCHGGADGSPGADGSAGSAGSTGTKGSVDLSLYPNLDAFF